MNGIEKIAARIEADTMAEIAAIEAEAEALCAQITAEAEARAAEEYAKRMAKGEAECAARRERMEAAAGMNERRAILEFKQRSLNEAFDRAVEAIAALPEAEYIAFLASLAAEASSNGREELIFAEADSKLSEAVVAAANALLAKKGCVGALRVSEERADIPGGIILKQGDIEVNCAVDSLVLFHKKHLAPQVAAILFN